MVDSSKNRHLLTFLYSFQTVVSGEVDPDTVILSRTWDGDVKVVSKQIGQKETILDADGKKTVGKETSELCISEEQAIKLGKVGFMLEKLFGGPRDIEWAFFKVCFVFVSIVFVYCSLVLERSVLVASQTDYYYK